MSTIEMEQSPQKIPSYMPMNQREDEIDLFELWDILWQQKKLIIMVTLLVVMMAVGYLMVTKPVYKAEVFFLPPLQQDVQALNLQGMQGIQGIQGIQKNTVLTRINVQCSLLIQRMEQNILHFLPN